MRDILGRCVVCGMEGWVESDAPAFRDSATGESTESTARAYWYFKDGVAAICCRSHDADTSVAAIRLTEHLLTKEAELRCQ